MFGAVKRRVWEPTRVVPSLDLHVDDVHEGCIRGEVHTTVTMKNAVFWDIKTQFYLKGDT
jgi:hypothetical protein